LNRAYKKAVRRWHPDKHVNNKEKAEMMTMEVNHAFEVLSNKNKKDY